MSRRAFTLIELLIVVAIIAILAAIAVPNFLEAQVRSKVSRVRADQRTAATAIETYRVDNNNYPPNLIDCGRVPTCMGWSGDQVFFRLTTPIAYLSSYESTRDVFSEGILSRRGPGLPGAGIVFDTDYMTYLDMSMMSADPRNNPVLQDIEAWAIRSIGPDASDDAADWRMYNWALYPNDFTRTQFLEGTYDPTNGTVSIGDICRFGGAVPPEAQAVMNF